MDQHDLKTCGISDSVRLLCSPEQQHCPGKVSSLSDCCGAFSDANAGLEKQNCDYDDDIDTCKTVKLPETGIKYGNHARISCTTAYKENADGLRPPLFSISTRNSAVQKDDGAEGTSSKASHCNMLVDNGNQKDDGISAYSPGGVDSTPNFSNKSGVSSEAGQPINKGNNELVDGRMHGYWLNAGEAGLKSIMQATYPNKQFKTESSSSNLTNATLPASSNDSCQDTSIDAKSHKHFITDSTDSSTCTDFKGSLEEALVKSSILGMAAQIPTNNVLDAAAFSPENQGNGVKASEIVISEHNSCIAEASNVQKSNLLGKEIAELTKDKAKPCYQCDDALEVARRVAREVEHDVGTYREASGSCSLQERSDETVHLTSVDSAVSNKQNFLRRTSCKSKLCNEQENCGSLCSGEELVNPEMLTRNEQLCSKGKLPSQDRGLEMTHEACGGCHGQSSHPTTNAEDIAANDQTTYISRIDLNEDILENEGEFPTELVKETVPCNAEIVSKPIPVAAKSGVPIFLPMPQIQFEGEVGGWRGSAATSAFRRTSLFETFNRTGASSINDSDNGSKHSKLKGIDLNVAAAGVDLETQLHQEKFGTTLSSFPSGESSVEVSSTRAERFNIDLNCASENDDNYHQTSASRPSVRDFDLNDNPTAIHVHSDAHQSGEGSLALRNRAGDHPVISFLGNTRQPDSNMVGSSYWTDLNHMKGFSHGHTRPFLMTAPSMLPHIEQMQKMVPLQHKLTHTQYRQPSPPLAFPCNGGFFIDPNNCLQSTVYPPGFVPYITDPRGTTVFPHVLGSSALPNFSGASHLLQLPGGPGPNDVAIIRPGFDPNGGMLSSEKGKCGENSRLEFIPLSNSTMEEQMKSFQQTALSATPMKRREPEGGWESQQIGYRHVPPWR